MASRVGAREAPVKPRGSISTPELVYAERHAHGP